MAKVRVLSWRGIPAQVKARDDAGKRVGLELPPWFSQEIDRVAMREGITGSDAYLDLDRHTDLETTPGIVVVRIDGPLFFANANRFA